MQMKTRSVRREWAFEPDAVMRNDGKRYLREHLRWRLAAAIAFCVLAAYISHDLWLGALGRTLVCEEDTGAAPAILLDNFVNDYGLFRRGAELQRLRPASRVVVPFTFPDEENAEVAAHEVANVFARLAGLSQWDLIPVEQKRAPISLNAAYRVREFLLKEHITSVTLVSPGFRSRRAEMIYQSVLSESGVTTECFPVFGAATPQTWTSTWHGIQYVGLQFMKLQYTVFGCCCAPRANVLVGEAAAPLAVFRAPGSAAALPSTRHRHDPTVVVRRAPSQHAGESQAASARARWRW